MADTNDQRKQQKRQRLRHKEQMLAVFFSTQQKYFEQLIKDTELEIELMRKYDA